MSMRIMHLSLDFPQGLTLEKMYGGMAREKKENLGISRWDILLLISSMPP